MVVRAYGEIRISSRLAPSPASHREPWRAGSGTLTHLERLLYAFVYATRDRNKRIRGTGSALHRLCAFAVPDPPDAHRRLVGGHAAKRACARRGRAGRVLHRSGSAIQRDTPVDASGGW